MPKKTVSLTLDLDTKEEAMKLAKSMGLSLSTLVELLLKEFVNTGVLSIGKKK